MRIGFVIMQIGNEELDQMYYEAIVPALEENDISPRRVDKHNEGGLLKSEIVGFIQEANIIIADLTNERPNCYLEVGYAMGIDKFRNLILTAREDHLPDSPDREPDGPKIHFDLAGYDIMFWKPDEVSEFRDSLTKRISRRLAIIRPPDETEVHAWNESWIAANREKALEGLAEVGLRGLMEARYALVDRKLSSSQRVLLDAADKAQIKTFGWPIGIVLNQPEKRPRPITDGIISEVLIKGEERLSGVRSSYDYWALNRTGDYYLLKNLFEDNSNRKPGDFLFFNTRIVRITEVLLHCARLYSNLQVDPSERVSISIHHGGIAGRKLASSSPSRMLSTNPESVENNVETEITVKLSSLESDLVSNVKYIAEPIFALFDFYEFADKIYEDLIQDFVDGKVT